MLGQSRVLTLLTLAASLAGVAACGGSDLSGKSWAKLSPRPSGIFTGAAPDPTGGLVSVSRDDNHPYRYQPDEDIWVDLGPFVIDEPPVLYNDPAGNVIAHASSGLYRLGSDDTWNLIIADPNAQLAANDIVWTVDGDDLSRAPAGGTPEHVVTLTAPSLQIDNTGTPFVEYTDAAGNDALATLSNTDATVTTMLTCASISEPYCLAHSDFFRLANGDIVFRSTNDIDNSRMYRLPGGTGTPVKTADFPVATSDGFSSFNHTLSFIYDAQGTGYATRSDNDGGLEELFTIDAGATAFEDIIETPGDVDLVQVGPDGTVYDFDDGGSRDFYALR